MSGEFNFDRMSGPVNRKLNFCELKLDHGDFIDRSSIDHKTKFLLIADRSIDRSDDQIGDSIMIAQPWILCRIWQLHHVTLSRV